jgi:hypothetical protein
VEKTVNRIPNEEPNSLERLVQDHEANFDQINQHRELDDVKVVDNQLIAMRNCCN